MIENPHFKCVFSPCRKYRYTLWRDCRDGGGVNDKFFFEGDESPSAAQRLADEFVQFIGLNPSTADETRDDNTVRRCIRFARYWGFPRMCMTNAFAYRSTDPAGMFAQKDPVGVENDRWLVDVARSATLVVACWGAHGAFKNRGPEVMALLGDLRSKTYHLGLTMHGYPRHPLYLKKRLQPIPFP